MESLSFELVARTLEPAQVPEYVDAQRVLYGAVRWAQDNGHPDAGRIITESVLEIYSWMQIQRGFNYRDPSLRSLTLRNIVDSVRDTMEGAPNTLDAGLDGMYQLSRSASGFTPAYLGVVGGLAESIHRDMVDTAVALDGDEDVCKEVLGMRFIEGYRSLQQLRTYTVRVEDLRQKGISILDVDPLNSFCPLA